ncbi:hypothetical protein Amsp01_040460 [Amycolatopsis sp. NBRC 101858]|nr:hypothetical protein Amsp01_040460 [Amycolatopsis sp. NBRC 101858]
MRERFQVSVSTAARWAGRYRDLGTAAMTDRPSRPRTSPNRTLNRVERRVIIRRWGPAHIAYLLGLNPLDDAPDPEPLPARPAHFAGYGITIRRVLTDNGSCYRSRPWRDTLRDAQITHKRTRPYRPQTNRKVERFNRTLLEEWAYSQPYRTETERRAALPGWLHTCNHHRGHTALAGRPRPNLTGQYT